MSNYPNIKFLSKFHRSNFSNELLFSSLFNFQPEAEPFLKNSETTRSILWSWYYLTLTQSYDLDKFPDPNLRQYDQETLFLLSRFIKQIKLESWFNYKLTGMGLRKYIKFEYFRRSV